MSKKNLLQKGDEVKYLGPNYIELCEWPDKRSIRRCCGYDGLVKGVIYTVDIIYDDSSYEVQGIELEEGSEVHPADIFEKV